MVWGTLWGSFTMLVACILLLLPISGPAGKRFCLLPWQYVAARAAWADIEALLVAVGAFVLWCTASPEGSASGLPRLVGVTVCSPSSARDKSSLHQPLVSP